MTEFAPEERKIYAQICAHNGIRAKDIAERLGCDRKTVNHYLYSSPLMKELCWEDRNYCWHGIIRQHYPHYGLGDFSGYYSDAAEFVSLDEETWFERLLEGCRNIGRNLSDARGLFHSFRDERETMLRLFRDLDEMGFHGYRDWEIAFELRLKKSRYLRIYCDVLLVTPERAFIFEFKMKNEILQEELQQSFKYCRYLDIILGERYEITPILVLTGGRELYSYADVEGRDASVQVSSGDMLYNVVDTYYPFLRP